MQETEVRRGDNRKVFDAVDTDGNGFLTYQDISFLSQEMGEKLTFQQLNTIMDTATDEGTMRRITMERFEEVCDFFAVLDLRGCWSSLQSKASDVLFLRVVSMTGILRS